MTRFTFAVVVLLLAFPEHSKLQAHESIGSHPKSAGPQDSKVHQAQGSWPSAILLPAGGEKTPWTNKPVLNDPDRFQIAIMTDRTGGHRPGVWMEAVRKLNLLRPEFVMSVGDLIEGYTEDKERAEQEWKEFLGFVEQLEMKFFFVAGNHDVSNSMLHNVWREKFGREWYSFSYRGVHFLCLCSEDPIGQHISEKQLEFIQVDLEENADARHTLVFLHKPLWTYAERDLAAGREDSTNWKRVEALLSDRPHSVFAGHVHHYVSYERNGGRKYYSLATTGGGSRLRGNNYGEFDHVMWLTMERSGPHVVNLRLDGVLPPDIVTEESATRFGDFLDKCTVEIAPILLPTEDGFSEGDVHLKLENEFGELVHVEGKLTGLPLKGVKVSPQSISLEVKPTEVAEQSIKVQFDDLIPFSDVAQTTFVAKMRTYGDKPITAERIFPVLIDRKYLVKKLRKSPSVDGRLSEWGDLEYRTSDNPLVMGISKAWQGPADGSLAFSTRRDDRNIYFGIRVEDERVVEGDSVRLIIDGRPLQTRLQDPRVRSGTARILVSAPLPSSSLLTDLDGVQGAGTTIADGYELEVALPVKWLDSLQGDGWNTLQLALQIEDVDDRNGDSSTILWRGGRSFDTLNTNYGSFVREE